MFFRNVNQRQLFPNFADVDSIFNDTSSTSSTVNLDDILQPNRDRFRLQYQDNRQQLNFSNYSSTSTSLDSIMNDQGHNSQCRMAHQSIDRPIFQAHPAQQQLNILPTQPTTQNQYSSSHMSIQPHTSQAQQQGAIMVPLQQHQSQGIQTQTLPQLRTGMPPQPTCQQQSHAFRQTEMFEPQLGPCQTLTPEEGRASNLVVRNNELPTTATYQTNPSQPSTQVTTNVGRETNNNTRYPLQSNPINMEPRRQHTSQTSTQPTGGVGDNHESSRINMEPQGLQMNRLHYQESTQASDISNSDPQSNTVRYFM